MKKDSEIIVDLSPLERFRNAVCPPLLNSGVEILRAWQAIYAAFIMNRFSLFSRGGGDWAHLKPKTIERKKSDAILVDKGLLRSALTPRIFGAFNSIWEERYTGGMWAGEIKNHGQNFAASVGFDGSKKYPDGSSVADIAYFHQRGTQHLPARRILVSPDKPTIALMAKAAKLWLKRWFSKANQEVAMSTLHREPGTMHFAGVKVPYNIVYRYDSVPFKLYTNRYGYRPNV